MNTSNTPSSTISSKILYGFIFTIIMLEIISIVSIWVKLPGYSGWGYSSIGAMLLILMSFISRKFTSNIKYLLVGLGIPSLLTLIPIVYLAYVFISYNNTIESKSQYLPYFTTLKMWTTIILILQTSVFFHYIFYINKTSIKDISISGSLHWILPLIAFGVGNTFLVYKLYTNVTHFLTDGYTNINL